MKKYTVTKGEDGKYKLAIKKTVKPLNVTRPVAAIANDAIGKRLNKEKKGA